MADERIYRTPPKDSGARPVPYDWQRWLSLRVPDLRAIQASWIDDVVRRRGISIYEEMLYDSQCASSIDLIKFAALSLSYDFNLPEDAQEDKKSQDALAFLQWTLKEKFPRGFKQFLMDALSCLEYGYSITEPKFKVGQWKKQKKFVIRTHTSLSPAMYGFELDDDCEVKGIQYMPTVGGSGLENYPAERFFILQWQTRFGSPYGRSQLRRAYEPWWMKQLLRRMRNTTLDRFGSPLIFFKVPKNYPEVDRKRLEKILRNLYAESGAVMDENIKQEVIEGQGGASAQAFQLAIDYEDAQIAKGITGVSLNANQGIGGAGSYAQSKVHQDNFLYLVQAVLDMLTEAINSQLIPMIMRYNFDIPEENYPRIGFEDLRVTDVQLIVQALSFANQSGITIPGREYAWMRDKLNLPPASEDVVKEIAEKAEQQKQMDQAQLQQQQQMGQPQPGQQDPEEQKDQNPQSYSGSNPEDPSGSEYDKWWRSFMERATSGGAA